MGKEKYAALDGPVNGDSEMLTGGSNNRRCSYKTATPLEKWLSLVLTLAVLAILALAIYIGIDRAHTNKTTVKSKPCLSADCVAFAGEIAASLNTSADPCENFYEYACGGYVATHIRPNDIGRLSSFSALHSTNKQRLRQVLATTPTSNASAVGKASQMYATCLDTNGANALGNGPLLDHIAQIGGLPVASPSTYDASTWNLNTSMVALQLYSASAGFASISISLDQKDTSKYVLHFYQAGLGMGSKSYYGNASKSPTTKRYQTAYRKYMTNVFMELGATQSSATQAFQEVFALEKELAGIMATLTQLRNPDITYNPWTIDDLQKALPSLAWETIVKDVLPDSSKGFITKNTKIIVQWPAYVSGLALLLDTYQSNPRILANYMAWIAIHGTLSHLQGALLHHQQTYARETAGTDPTSRTTFCVTTVDKRMGSATSRLFVDKYFSPATRKEASTVIANVRRAFLDNLHTVRWMDAETQAAAAEKARATRQEVGYADFIKNDTALNKRYANLMINDTCHYCNLLAAQHRSNLRNYAKLLSPVVLEFDMTAPTVNAYYQATDNVIVFPAGILQPNFYYATGPAAMNYGGIGSVVGHELTHGFDDKGRHYDKEGNLKPWWSKSSIEKFTKKANCIADQYTNYTFDLVNGHITLGENRTAYHANGHMTLGENIADHGGIKMSFNAYQRYVKESGDSPLPGLDLSLDQLFFVSFARTWCSISAERDVQARLRTDVHAPTPIRVIGTVSDDENFAKAFKCRKGSKMNPVKQCLLW